MRDDCLFSSINGGRIPKKKFYSVRNFGVVHGCKERHGMFRNKYLKTFFGERNKNDLLYLFISQGIATSNLSWIFLV